MEDFVIKHSKLGGNGLFATKPFPKHTVIMRMDGAKLTKAQTVQLPKADQHHLLQIGPDLFLDFTGRTHLFINHNCSPNCYVKVLTTAAFLLSAIPIHNGDELTFDYSTTSLDMQEEWSMPCRCGNFSCRKVISGWGGVPEKTKERYRALKIVPEFVLKSGL